MRCRGRTVQKEPAVQISSRCFDTLSDGAPQYLNLLLSAADVALTSYYAEIFSSLSTLFLTVGRFIMRSCQAV